MPMTPKYLRIIGLAALSAVLAVRVRSAAVALVSPQKKNRPKSATATEGLRKKIIP